MGPLSFIVPHSIQVLFPVCSAVLKKDVSDSEEALSAPGRSCSVVCYSRGYLCIDARWQLGVQTVAREDIVF